MKIITLDVESYYDKDYSLSKITTEEYVRDPRFEVIGVATKVDDEPIQWVSGSYKEIKAHLDSLPWEDHLLLAQNTAFDAAILNWRLNIKPVGYLDTMSMAAAIHGLESSVSLASLAKLYGEEDKGQQVKQYIGYKRKDFSPLELEDYATYCKHDVELCYNIFNKMITNFPKPELRVIDLTIRMFAEPRLLLDEKMLVDDLMQIRTDKRGALLTLMHLLGVKNEDDLKKQLMSNDKFADLLKSRGVEPPTKISEKTGKEAWAFAKTDEEFTDLMDSEDPIIATLVSTRLSSKSTIGETRTEAYANIAARGTYPFSLKYSGAMITHRWCLTGDHEVLTPNGWVRLDLWQGGSIMQFDGVLKTLSYYDAQANEWDANENLIAFNERHHTALCTREHTLATRAHHNDWVSSSKAETMLQTKTRMMYVSGLTMNPDDSRYTDAQLRLMVAMQADGYNVNDDKNNMVRFRFTRKHKIERIQHLLTDADIPYKVTTYPSEPHVTVVKVKGRDAPEWLRAAKELPSDWINLSARQIMVVLGELPRWDGSYQQGNSVSYVSTNKTAIDLYATLAHLVGRRARISDVLRVEGWNKAWSLYITCRDTTMTGHCVTEQAYTGKVYCPTTKTGFFLCRRNGVIFVTGNSGFDTNPQNLPRGSTLRNAIMAPEGYQLVVADLSNIELRLGMWLAGQVDAIRQINDGLDLYRVFASEAFNIPYDEIAKDSNERFISKVCCLSLIYGTGSEKLKNTIRIQSKGKTTVSAQEADRLKSLYREKNTNVVDAWREGTYILEWILNDECHTAYEFLPVLGKGGIIKPNGLALPYPGLTVAQGMKGDEWTYKLRKGKAFMTDRVYGAKVFQRCTQSLARDIIAKHTMDINKSYWVAGLVHDEVIAVVPDDQVEQAKIDITNIMRTPPTWAPDLPLDCEVGSGKRYGEAK